MPTEKPTTLASGKQDAAPDLQAMLDDQAKLLDMQAKQITELTRLVMDKLNGVAPTTAIAHDYRTEQQRYVDKLLVEKLVKEEEDKKKYEREEKWCAVESDIRSQVVLNKQFTDGDQLWEISIGSGKHTSVPPFVIRGHSEDEAVARFNRGCGIKSVQENVKQPEWTTYHKRNVTNDKLARERASLTHESVLIDTYMRPREIKPVP